MRRRPPDNEDDPGHRGPDSTTAPKTGQTAAPAPVEDPDTVLERLLDHPHVHPYGIADVTLFWPQSRWWLGDGGGAVGLIDLPGSPTPVLYAVTADAREATLALLGALAPALPDRFMATGPVGVAERLAPTHTASVPHRYRKMHLAHPDRLPPPHPEVVVLGTDDLANLEELFATDPDAGDFFHAGLLDTGHYVGIRSGGRIVAAAGIHIIDPWHSVAALGNIATHPAHRRRGLARAAVATLCHRLLSEVATIGLNVRQHNAAAARLYEQLGFLPSVDYEEAAFVQVGGGAP